MQVHLDEHLIDVPSLIPTNLLHLLPRRRRLVIAVLTVTIELMIVRRATAMFTGVLPVNRQVKPKSLPTLHEKIDVVFI